VSDFNRRPSGVEISRLGALEDPVNVDGRPTEQVVMTQMGPAARSPFTAWITHLRNPRLRAAFGIGFCILFAFIGTFTYVNFVLVRPPLSLGPMELGFVYFVFLPSVVTTLLAGRAVHGWGTRLTLWSSLALAGLGIPTAIPTLRV
jgi:predicted MFS family arabinose efflux permease